ncbi:MAG: hypothetical protein KAS16_07080 [Thermoplasmata archaeon]|nr:hypothetical protein [Thermoplasmata archaeon]
MIKELLKIVTQQNAEIRDVAKELDMTVEQLVNRIITLANMNYIEIIEEVDEKGNPCAFCPSSKACSILPGYTGTKAVRYKLTEKGERALNGDEDEGDVC